MRKLHLAIVPLAAIIVVALLLAAPRPSSQLGAGTTGFGTTTGAPPQVQSLPAVVPSIGPVTVVTAAPRPSEKLGDATSYFKPTPTPQPRIVDGITGEATWWNSFGSGIYVALRPDLGSKGDLVIVCGGQPFHCVTAPVITSCACMGPNSDRLVDLSLDLFREFADPSRGTVRIVLQVVRNGR